MIHIRLMGLIFLPSTDHNQNKRYVKSTLLLSVYTYRYFLYRTKLTIDITCKEKTVLFIGYLYLCMLVNKFEYVIEERERYREISAYIIYNVNDFIICSKFEKEKVAIKGKK